MPIRARAHNPDSRLTRDLKDRARMQAEQERHRERMNSYQRGYNKSWQKASRAFLQAHPLCAGPDSRCAERGKRTPSTEVDHIVPHRGSLRVFWNQDNWQALCHVCHSSKTAREDGGFGRHVKPARERRRNARPEHAPPETPTPTGSSHARSMRSPTQSHAAAAVDRTGKVPARRGTGAQPVTTDNARHILRG